MNRTTVIEDVKPAAPQRAYRLNRQSATSDDEIAKAAQDRLHTSPYFALRSIMAEFHEGAIVLRGRVASYYHKQMAREVVRRVDGIGGVIINLVEVIQGAGVSTLKAAGEHSASSGGEPHVGLESKMW